MKELSVDQIGVDDVVGSFVFASFNQGASHTAMGVQSNQPKNTSLLSGVVILHLCHLFPK